MKAPLLALLLLCAAPAAARPVDLRLSSVIKADFETAVSSYPMGGTFLRKIKDNVPEYSWLSVVFGRSSGDNLAWYDGEHNAIFFDSDSALKFLRSRGYRGRDPAALLLKDRRARAELVRSAGAVYMHELVHALQYYTYPEYYKDAGGIPLEFEYQAYLVEDLCLHDQLKAEPGLLRALLRGTLDDIYIGSNFGSYLNFSLDPERYREHIKKLYEAHATGYVSIDKAEEERRGMAERSKILAYAGGDGGAWKEDSAALERLKAQKESYAAFLNGFYDKYWPLYSADILSFVGGMALEEKNYTLALSCLAGADVNSAKYPLTEGQLKDLRTKGALAVLETASYLRDNAVKVNPFTLAQYMKSLEEACAATGRPFPEDLLALRNVIYPIAAERSAGLLRAEKDPLLRETYAEDARYFSATAGGVPAR